MIMGGFYIAQTTPRTAEKRRLAGYCKIWDNVSNTYIPNTCRVIVTDNRTETYVASTVSRNTGYFEIKGIQILPDNCLTVTMHDIATGETLSYGRISLVL